MSTPRISKHIHKAKYDEETGGLLDECAECGEDFRNTDVHLMTDTAAGPLQQGGNMKYEVLQDKQHPQDWRVEAIDRHGSCFVTVFGGPDAEQRAREYARFKSA